LAKRSNNFHLNSAERGVFLSIRWIVGQGVLAADIARHLSTNLVRVLDILRKERESARGLGDVFEGFAGVLGGFACSPDSATR